MDRIVAIVGRPNVGKSTLFNRMIGERKAIIDDESGVTRDRQYGLCEWNGKIFTVVDTGGFVEHSEDIFEKAIRSQVRAAIEEASILILVVDVTTGITDLDDDMAEMLRRSKKKVFLVVNKVDNHERLLDANEFWSLGFEHSHFLSAITGSGTGEVLDDITDHLPEELDTTPDDLPKIAIIGQPNVGKSSLMNALLDEERNIVTDIAGTTRDTIHTVYKKFGHEFLLIDTAGVRRKSKVHENLEFYSVMRAIKALEEADVCLLVLDATLGVEAQDLNIFRLMQKRNKGIVILINKWDLIDKETNTARDMETEIRERLAPFNDLHFIFMSATEKLRIHKAVDAAMEVYQNRSSKIPTSKLNDVMLPFIENTPPPTHRGKYIRIKFVTQLPTYYPAFAFYCNHPRHVKESYSLFLENKLRENFQLTGCPISVFFRQK